jgi:hypothetical protein
MDKRQKVRVDVFAEGLPEIAEEVNYDNPYTDDDSHLQGLCDGHIEADFSRNELFHNEESSPSYSNDGDD